MHREKKAPNVLRQLRPAPARRQRRRQRAADAAIKTVIDLLLRCWTRSAVATDEGLCGWRSVEVRLGEWKCVLDQLDTRPRVICNDYFHHVESEKDIGIVEHSQPRERAA